ncbi:MAG: cupin domain-containing protein [Microbacterium sp.]
MTSTSPLFVTDGPSELGVWTMERGALRDIEVDEIFVVLTGRALLTINGAPPREIAPGDIVHLRAGDETTWAVQSTLRKFYIAPLNS